MPIKKAPTSKKKPKRDRYRDLKAFQKAIKARRKAWEQDGRNARY